MCTNYFVTGSGYFAYYIICRIAFIIKHRIIALVFIDLQLGWRGGGEEDYTVRHADTELGQPYISVTFLD
jgi:hypothetical protein